MELTFIRNGNAPSSNVFNLKLESKTIIKNLILESQNNKFPENLNVELIDFIGNEISLKARKIRTMGNIEEWELDPVLTNEVKIKIQDSEASIINITPVLISTKDYYAQEDVDTRIADEKLEILNQNASDEVVVVLEESKIIDRVKLNKNISGLEIYYSPGEGQNWLPLSKVEINNTFKFHPVMAKALKFKSTANINLQKNELDIFIFNYFSIEIESLFIDETYSDLVEDITIKTVLDLEKRVVFTNEYLEKIRIAKNILIGRMMRKEIEYSSNDFKVFSEFSIDSESDVFRVEVSYKDQYDNEENLVTEDIDENKVVTFNNFYGKNLKFTLYGPSEDEVVQISEVELDQKDFYSSIDEDVRLDKSIMTATSLCGHYSNNIAANVINGNENSTFHSADYRGYGTGEYGELILELGDQFVIDRIEMSTRASGNGRIKAYEILYRNSNTNEWRKVFEQLTEESGLDRNSKFKPIFASEICVRVTNGENHFMVIREMYVYKHNTLEITINNLFEDETETSIREDLTLEEIEALEVSLITPEYIEKVKKAKELFIDTLIPNEFKLDLQEKTILDKIEFSTDEKILRVELKYKDTLENEFKFKIDPTIVDCDITLEFDKILSKDVSVLIYGAENIYKLKNNTYNILDYMISEDIDTRVKIEDMTVTASHQNNSYPVANLTDGSLDSVYHSTQYTGHTDVYFKLNEKKIIDRTRLVSFRSNTSGLVREFKILGKALNNTWVEFGTYNVESFKNEWLMIENEAYLTDEICVRVTDSINGWAFINEVEIFMANSLEDEINNLFTDDTFTELKDEVEYIDILRLEERVLITDTYKVRILKAKDLYLDKLDPVTFEIENADISVIKDIEIIFKEKPEYIYAIKISYKNTRGDIEYLDDIRDIEVNDKKLDISFDEILTSSLKIELMLNSYERWKFNCIHVQELDQSIYYNVEDVINTYPMDDIEIESMCGGISTIDRMRDGNLGTYFHSNSQGMVIFKFKEKKVFDEFRYYCMHGNGNNGKVYRASVLYRQNPTEAWKTAYNYRNSNAFSGENKFSFEPVLASEIAINFEEVYAGVVIINDFGFSVYNRFEKIVNNLFKDQVMFTSLVKGVSLNTINSLREKVSDSKELSAKLYIAESIIKNRGSIPFESYKIRKIEKTTGEYFNPLATGNTDGIVLTPYYLEPNKDYAIISNKDVKGNIVIRESKPLEDAIISIKKGVNIINLGDVTGQLVIISGRSEEIELYSLSGQNALIYQYGFSSEEDFFLKTNNDTKFENGNGNIWNSNLAYIEGRNFVAAVRFNWIKNNLKKGELSSRIEYMDEFLDFLYYIDNIDGHFKYGIPYKRIMWLGLGSDNPHRGGCFAGFYTAYSGGNGSILNSSVKNLASGWVVGHEVGHEMDVDRYHMGLFGEVMNNWYAEEARIEYVHAPRTAGNLVNIENSEQTITQMGLFDRLAFWVKFRLYYGDNSFFTKMNAYMQSIGTTSSEDMANKLAGYISRILKRDASDLFLKHSFPMTEAGIEYCNTFPKFTIDIAKINWSNQDEFRREEKELFNKNLKG